MDYQSLIIDSLDEGIIAIDSQALIKIYNRMAREIFGLNPEEGPGHPEGRITEGDIVIIADNLLGGDDGGMDPDDLRLIGIDPSGITRGDALVAIGKKGEKIGSGVFNKLDKKKSEKQLFVETRIDGLMLEARIDFDLKRLRGTVEGSHYDYIFRWAAGHMVVVDGTSHEVKFYQTRGFTARKEELRTVLYGQAFQGKGKFGHAFQVLERNINEIHPNSEIIRDLIAVAQGENFAVRGLESMINGIPVRCSMEPLLVAGKRVGALLKVQDITELKALQSERQEVLTSLETIENRIKIEHIQKEAFKDIVGAGDRIRRVVEMAKKVAQTNSTVLLTGESGTGKGLFAEAIHKASSRRDGPFVYVNCASIPDALLESELFGHEKGAFTGAVAEKQGKFELANGGTIFLDEIAELPLSLQAKILHVIQKRTFTRVGGVKPIQVDIRVIVASNRDLEEAVKKGEFREDLFYRINVISILLPPLREHKEDLYLLVGHILPRVGQRTGKGQKRISTEVMKIFLDYNWPGNVRELENVLERATIMADGDMIMREHLPEYIVEQINDPYTAEGAVCVKRIRPLKELIAETEVNAVRKALEICGGNRKKAMEILGIRKTNFYKKLRKIRGS